MKPLCSIIGMLLVNSTFSQCPPTTPTITGTSVLCNGASGSLSASGSGDTYTWSPGGANTSSISISPSSTTTYSLVMGQTGCTVTSSAAITITVANTPTVVAKVPGLSPTATSFSTCGSNSPYPALQASGASTYTWSTGANTANITVSIPITFGTPPYINVYTVTGENACGTATASITFYVYSYPTLSMSSSKPVICPGEPVILNTVSSATNYKWRISGSATVIATTPSISVSPTLTTTYRLEVSTTGHCLRYDQIKITVNPCTGIDELSDEAGPSLYPNPVGDLLYVDVSDHQGPGVLEVYDATGKMLIKEAVSGSKNVIHTDALQPGIYFYRVAEKTGTFMKQ